MMEALSTSETSVNIDHTRRRNIPEDSHLQLKVNLNRRVSLIFTGDKVQAHE
jgi:hypothetical protein